MTTVKPQNKRKNLSVFLLVFCLLLSEKPVIIHYFQVFGKLNSELCMKWRKINEFLCRNSFIVHLLFIYSFIVIYLHFSVGHGKKGNYI